MGTEGSSVWYSFTDSQPQNVTATNTSVSVASGSTANYGTLSVTFNGNNSACTVDLAIVGALPAGAAAVFGTSSLTSSNNVTQATTLTITTTAGTTPTGTTTFRVAANGRSNCQGSASATSNLLTLVVTGAPVNVAPVLAEIGNQSGDEGTLLTFTPPRPTPTCRPTR